MNARGAPERVLIADPSNERDEVWIKPRTAAPSVAPPPPAHSYGLRGEREGRQVSARPDAGQPTQGKTQARK